MITRPLVIDPVMAYSTYLGGKGYDEGRRIAVDARGNAYVLGFTDSDDLLTTPGAVQRELRNPNGDNPVDAFITKILTPRDHHHDHNNGRGER